MSNTFQQLYYHLVWGTKNREPLITLEIEKLVKSYVPKKISEYEGIIMALNNVEDHLHLLCHIPPKVSISDFVNKVKGSSSHYVNALLGEKKFYWQTGYGAFSLAKKDIPYIKRYIIKQKEHHKNSTLIDYLEKVDE